MSQIVCRVYAERKTYSGSGKSKQLDEELSCTVLVDSSKTFDDILSECAILLEEQGGQNWIIVRIDTDIPAEVIYTGKPE